MNALVTMLAAAILFVTAPAPAQVDCFDYDQLPSLMRSAANPSGNRLVVIGDAAYTFPNVNQMGVFALEDGINPVVVAYWQDRQVSHLAAVGEDLLAVDGLEVAWLDCADPLDPAVAEVASHDLGLGILAVAGAPGVGLVLADNDDGRQLGIFTLAPLAHRATLAVPASARSLAVADGLACVGGVGDELLTVISLADPAAPVVLATVDPLGHDGAHASAMLLADQRLIMLESGEPETWFHSFDLAVPEAPAVQGSVAVDLTLVTLSGEPAALAAGGLSGVALLDWSDPTQPDIELADGAVAGPGVFRRGDAFLACSSSALRAYEMGSGARPSVTRVPVVGTNLGSFLPVGDLMWITDMGWNQPRIRSVDPETGEQVGDLQLPGPCTGMELGPDGTMVVATIGGGSWLLDAGAPAQPSVLTRILEADRSMSIWLDASTVLIADDPYDNAVAPRLLRVDVSSPTDPQVTGILEGLACVAITAHDGWAYARLEDGSLQVVDARDPGELTAGPVLASTTGIPIAGNTTMDMAGTLLLMRDSYVAELHVFDVGDPGQPSWLGAGALVRGSSSITVLQAGVLYVLSAGDVDVYQLDDPLDPTYLGRLDANVERLTATDEVLYGRKSNELVTMPLQCASVTAAPDLPATTASLEAWPNPFNPMVQIAFRVPASGDLSLTIHDLAGRRVATVVDGYVDAGPRVWTWNGRDGGGRALPSGVYLAHLRTGSARASAKLLMVR